MVRDEFIDAHYVKLIFTSKFTTCHLSFFFFYYAVTLQPAPVPRRPAASQVRRRPSLFVWLVADGWCWFYLREKYCWLVAGG
jgi:hypothetical protein